MKTRFGYLVDILKMSKGVVVVSENKVVDENFGKENERDTPHTRIRTRLIILTKQHGNY
jgi:hypothetical protein